MALHYQVSATATFIKYWGAFLFFRCKNNCVLFISEYLDLFCSLTEWQRSYPFCLKKTKYIRVSIKKGTGSSLIRCFMKDRFKSSGDASIWFRGIIHCSTNKYSHSTLSCFKQCLEQDHLGFLCAIYRFIHNARLLVYKCTIIGA